MSEDNKNKYEIPFYGQMPGCSELSEMELACVRAAGIDPDMLSAADRAAIIKALIKDFNLIKNPHAGDVAALLFQFCLLQDMLSDEKKEEWEEEEEEKKEKEKKRKEKEQQLFLIEMQRMQEMQAGHYLLENPIPPYVFEPIVEQTMDLYQNPQIIQASDFAVPYVEALQEALLLPSIETIAPQTNAIDLDSTIVELPPSSMSYNPIAQLDLSDINLSHMLGIEIVHHDENELPPKANKTPDIEINEPEPPQIARA